jgi:hypothetical protein
MYEQGIAGMRYSISDTAEYGDLTRGPRIIDAGVKAEMRKILDEIQDGRFAEEWVAEAHRGGRPELRGMMPWIVSGRFVSIDAQPDTGYFATVDAATGALAAAVPHGYPEGAISSEGFISQKLYAVVATDDAVWLGGEPHVLIELDPDTLTTRRFWYTNPGLGDVGGGGDIQAIAVTEDRVWAGCHCWGSVGQFDPLAPGEWSNYRDWVQWFRTQANPPVRAVFGVDRAGSELADAFQPELTGDDGVWAIIEDSNGVMWFGGEFTSASGRYPGGFVRYADTEDPTPIELVAAGSRWSYWHDPAAPPTNWRSDAFDASAWPVGRAELGFGDGDEATVLDPQRWTRSAYFRQEFTLTDTDTATALALEVVADDGYVAWLNGTEVERVNLAPGPVGHTQWATASIWGSAEQTPTRTSLPVGLLRDGVNVLTVQVANGNTGDLSFAASLHADASQPLVGPPPLGPPPEPAPMLVSDLTTPTQVTLRWTHPTGADVATYEVRRDGVVIGTSSTSFSDTDVVAGATHVYDVVTVGLDGQRSRPSNAVTATVGQRADSGRSWARTQGAGWRWTATEPAADWTAPDFDDAAWSTGSGRIGHDTGGLDTDTGPTSDLWLRSTFTVSSARSTPEQILLFVDRDDGIVVHLNGAEVHRDNLPVGPISMATEPRVGVWRPNDRALHYAMIPGDLLRAGTNTVAVRLVNSTGSTDIKARLGMLSLDYDRPGIAGSSPTRPSGLAAVAGASGVSLTWRPSSDDGVVTGYVVLRDGAAVGASATPGFFDPAPAGDHTYTVVAVDSYGGRSRPSAPTTVTIQEAGPAPLGADVCVRREAAGGGVRLDWGLPGNAITVRRNGSWLTTISGADGRYIDRDGTSADSYQVRNYGAGGRTIDCTP